MGGSQSREEIIVAQAGNSGGISQSASQKQPTSELSVYEILGTVSFAVNLLFVVYFIYYVMKKKLEQKVYKEVRRSSENIV